MDLHYWGDENDYGKRVFDRTDIQRMADFLRDLQWQFILLINDVPEIREVFDEFYMEPVKLTYSIFSGTITGATELIIVEKKLLPSCSKSSEFYA